jgi:hypothetical protein
MNINFSNNLKIKPTFQRKIRNDEKEDYSKTINEAFDYLGIKNRALIIHGSSFPNDINKNINSLNDYNIGNVKDKNPYIGSPYFNEEFLEFAKMNGFNSIQLGPNGKLNKKVNSPYKSSVFAKNELFLNYKKLKSDDYANILTDKDTNSINYISKKPDINYDMTDFNGAKEISELILDKAYNNFRTKIENNDSKAIKLNKEFDIYKKNNNNWLEKDSIFNLLSNINGTDNFENWESDIDKNLISKKESGDKIAITRYNQILTNDKYKNDIDKYKFEQFLISKEEKEDKLIREKEGIKYIGDLLVGYSYSDEWSNPNAFLKDWRVGAEYGGKNDGPQLWDIPVLNPDKLFNKDGSLGVSGKLLKEKMNKALDGVENIRIDNVMGLVDPYIYKSSAVDKGGNISKYNRGYLSEINGVDENHNYRKIIHNIILPSLKEHNINPNDVIWEDLGAQSQVFKDVFYNGIIDGIQNKEDKLNGIAYSIGVKMENPMSASYSFLATHDNEPAQRLLKQNWIYGNEGWNPMYLAGYLMPPYNEEQAKKSADFCKDIENNPKTRLKAKYAELFRGTPNIQISFVDFFGIDKVYNYAGRDDIKDNWKLRLNPDYKDTYYKSLEIGEEPVMNMPELLGIAVNSKAGIAIAKKEITEENSKKQIGNLQTRLEYWNNILKEKE